MIEVLWHGRGGQGAFTAARLLGSAASLPEGACALAFPSFGPERRGAPMRAFTKIDDEPIGDRSASVCADFVVYLDETLLAEGWESELKPGGRVLVNSTRPYADARILPVDADGISRELLGRAIPNTAFLGALAALCDCVEKEAVCESVRQYMPERLHAKNIAIVEAVYDQMSLAPAQEERASGAAEMFHVKHSARCEGEHGASDMRPPSIVPTLRTGGRAALEERDYARDTCFEAGYLVAKNAGWRSMRPVIDVATCTGCFQCYMYCPDGTVFRTAKDEGKPTIPAAAAVLAGSAASTAGAVETPSTSEVASVEVPDDIASLPAAPVAIDYDFCKGCGVCAKACKFGAISMVAESEVAR